MGDWQWVQNQCLSLLEGGTTSIRQTALISLGHIARIHGKLDLGMVLPVIRKLEYHSDLTGTVEDALSDINMFILDDK